MVHASICRLKDDKLVFYSSENDSIIFYRKTKMEMEVMQTMNSTTNQLLTETYASLCPILINYIYRRINDYDLPETWRKMYFFA